MFQVQMVDREEQWVHRGQKIISDFLGKAIERRIFSQSQVEEIKARISGVIGETTSTRKQILLSKQFLKILMSNQMFSKYYENCGDQTILASNTSSLNVNELSKATTRPDRFVGLHFFYHPKKSTCQSNTNDASSEDTISRVVQYCKQLGKVVIVCKDKPGFVVNRFFVPWLNEACLLMQEGHGTPN